MTKDALSLKDVERQAYRSTFKDGFYDIQFGVLFLVIALISVLETINISRFVGYTLFVIPLIIPWLGKKYITIPRMGAVEFGKARKMKKQVALIIGAIVIFLTLPILLLIVNQNLSGVLGWKILVIFAMPLFVIAVYTTDFLRIYIYAGLLIAAVAESEFLLDLLGTPFNAIFSFGLPGLIISVIGINLLIKFVQNYPRNGAVYVEQQR